jgi:hypothetical protein
MYAPLQASRMTSVGDGASPRIFDEIEVVNSRKPKQDRRLTF